MPASNSFPSASVKPRSAISPRSSGLLISMTSVQCPSPSAPIFTNLKIQATRPPQSKNRREKYPFGAPTPNLEPVPQPDPDNIVRIKAELQSKWSMTGLLDMVKECDLRLGLTDAFKSPTSHENLDRSALRPRLLLCLHGLGTNAGLQRMASLGSGVTIKDLAYVRRRHLCVRIGLQALRSMGSEPDDAMARSLRRSRRDDLLARREEIAMHSFAAEIAVVIRGRLDDRGRAAPLHRDGGRSAICR